MRVIRAKPGDWITPQIRAVTHAIVVVGDPGDTRDEIAAKTVQVIRAERERRRRHRIERRKEKKC